MSLKVTSVVYVLILLGLAVVISPLISVMPSKFQRAKAALRDEARTRSFRVSLRPLPAVPPRFRLQIDAELACYERRLSRSLSVLEKTMSYVFVDGVWCSTVSTGDAAEWLAGLPEGAVYVERGGQAVSIFWDEKAGSEGLMMILQAIENID